MRKKIKKNHKRNKRSDYEKLYQTIAFLEYYKPRKTIIVNITE